MCMYVCVCVCVTLRVMLPPQPEGAGREGLRQFAVHGFMHGKAKRSNTKPRRFSFCFDQGPSRLHNKQNPPTHSPAKARTHTPIIAALRVPCTIVGTLISYPTHVCMCGYIAETKELKDEIQRLRCMPSQQAHLFQRVCCLVSLVLSSSRWSPRCLRTALWWGLIPLPISPLVYAENTIRVAPTTTTKKKHIEIIKKKRRRKKG
jgi:hypothetical protein